MTFSPKSATALALVLILAACGGGAEEADETARVTTDGGAATAPAATPASGETPAPGATPTPAASPTSTATPGASAAAAPAAAAMAEPAAFAVCKACHSVEQGENGIGPSLAGIWGEKAGAVPGFEFTDAMKNSGLVWNQATLDRYLENPREVVPGTTMAFGGVKDDAKRQAIVDYIKGL